MTDEQVVNLATALRPRVFTDMVGQPFAQGIGRRIGSGRISGQGYILAGPGGCGKTSLARIIAMALNCSHMDKKTGNPCGECESCRLALQGAHTYIHEIDAASKRGIQAVRDFLSSASYSVPDDTWRVFILDEVHRLTPEAFDVLLKPIEEPHHHVMFIMLTTNPEAIPKTIVTRCPIIPILPLSEEDNELIVRAAVGHGLESDPDVWRDVTDSDIRAAVLSAQGSARQAITNISGVVYHGVTQGDSVHASEDIARAIIEHKVADVLALMTQAMNDKTTDIHALILAILHYMMEHIRGEECRNQSVVASQVAELSLVSSRLSMSSPAVMCCAQVASVAGIGAGVPGDRRTDATERVGKRNISSQTHPPAQSSKLITVTDDMSEDDIIGVVLSSRCKKVIGKHWWAVLDNEEASEFFIKNDTLHVRLADGRRASELQGLLSKIFARVQVKQMTR